MGSHTFVAICVLRAQDEAAVGRVTPILPGLQSWTEPQVLPVVAEPEGVEFIGDDERTLVPPQPQRKVALNAERVRVLTNWDSPHLLIVGDAVLRLENGVDLLDIRERLAAWNTMFDPVTGLWKRASLEEYARQRRRKAAVALLSDSVDGGPLHLQSVARNLSNRLAPHQTIAYLRNSQFAILAEDESAQSLANGLRSVTSDGLATVDWEGHRRVRLLSVSTNVENFISLATSIDRCVAAMAAMKGANPQSAVV